MPYWHSCIMLELLLALWRGYCPTSKTGPPTRNRTTHTCVETWSSCKRVISGLYIFESNTIYRVFHRVWIERELAHMRCVLHTFLWLYSQRIVVSSYWCRMHHISILKTLIHEAFQGKTDVAMLTILRVLHQHRSNASTNAPLHSTIHKDDFKVIYVWDT